jgi:hypothetical protein
MSAMSLSLSISSEAEMEEDDKTYPIINGPNPALRSTINVFLTPASLNAEICAGESCTPAGEPLIILNQSMDERG